MRRSTAPRARRAFRRSACSALALAILVGGLLSACTESGDQRAHSSRSATPGHSPTTAAPIRVAVVGDSNTTGLSGTLEHGIAAGQSWVAQLHEPRFVVVGGWARDGASTALMAEQLKPLEDVDVLVLMGGTNDPPLGIDQASTITNLHEIVDIVRPRSVVLSSIPPIQAVPERATALNDDLRETAVESKWRFADPWAPLRASGGTWKTPYLRDGIHTTAAGYALVGRELEEAVSDSAADLGASY